jgi:TonB family protein
MRGLRRKLAAAASLLLAAMAGCTAFAQTVSRPPPVVRITRVPIAVTSKADVAIVNFFNPVYPPLARSASVSGDVVLKVGIHKDGSIESVAVLSDNPLLTQAALDSAQHSQFECRGCSDEVTPTSLSYSFQLVAGPDFPCPEGNGLQVTRSQNRVSVVAERGWFILTLQTCRFLPQNAYIFGPAVPAGAGRITITPGFVPEYA